MLGHVLDPWNGVYEVGRGNEEFISSELQGFRTGKEEFPSVVLPPLRSFVRGNCQWPHRGVNRTW